MKKYPVLRVLTAATFALGTLGAFGSTPTSPLALTPTALSANSHVVNPQYLAELDTTSQVVKQQQQQQQQQQSALQTAAISFDIPLSGFNV